MPKARVSRIGGLGKADCGTQAERMWSRGPAGSVTRRFFGFFLIAQKETRPAGRNLPNKKSGSDAERHSHKNLTYGRGGETQFRTKLF